MPCYETLPSGSVRARVYVGFIDGKSKYEYFTASTQEKAAMLAYEYLIELDLTTGKQFSEQPLFTDKEAEKIQPASAR